MKSWVLGHRVLLAASAVIIGAVALAGFLVFRGSGSELPPQAQRDLEASRNAARYNGELNALAGKMARETSPQSLRDMGIEVASIQDDASRAYEALPASPSASASRDAVRTSLRNIVKAAKELKVAEEALRMGIRRIAEAEDASASVELASSLDEQAAVAARGRSSAEKAAIFLRRSSSALSRAKAEIRRIGRLNGVDPEELGTTLASLDRRAIPSGRDVRRLAARLRFQQSRLARLGEELDPTPVVIQCGQGISATSPVSSFNPDADSCSVASLLKSQYERNFVGQETTVNVASVGNYFCQASGSAGSAFEAGIIYRCTFEQDSTLYVEFPIGG